MLNDILANTLSKLLNAEKRQKTECLIKPSSKVVKKVLEVMKDNLYIGNYVEIKDNRGNVLKVNLIGKINNCCVIKPRHAVKIDMFEKFEKRFLPAKGFGIIIISTNQGIMTIEEARKKKIGGKLIAYCY
ncbi:30S ribosomal protein S8 [Candidatus Woesearchaeota archaeon B3_Woes]|nr:MAG: 30S ribosomal protein S8 [Candidatus Woesearchaeota archaeon B3_Woes]